MDFGWLKRYFPRSLFGRAFLIVLFPVIGLQLIVGQVFIQRHFQRVTEQMADSVALEINYAIQLIELAETVENAQAALDEISVNLELLLLLNVDGSLPPRDIRLYVDLSGKALINSLNRNIDAPLRVDLRQDIARVSLRVKTTKGILEIVLPRSRVAASNPHQLLVLMVFASIILVVISMGFLRIQIRPISRLAEAAEAFGKGQITPMHPSGSTEVRRASLAFLNMRNKLDRQMEQRTQMLSGVSHDLRTPLTRMKLALELMDKADDLKQDVADMEKMLDDFLAFAKDDKAEVGTAINPFDLAQEVISKLERNGNLIDLAIDTQTLNLTNVVLRPEAIKRALQNLLDNAQKYAQDVLLTIVLSEKFLEYRVEDNGPGIDKIDHEAALRPFYRLDKARSADGSVGLGLSIAADIARSHGGKLELSDSKILSGLCVRLTIPR